MKPEDVVAELREFAKYPNTNFRYGEHVLLVKEAADLITSLQGEVERLKTSQHPFKDEDWPLSLQRLNHTEPGPDQGIAVVGTNDLAFALERLAHFADVAMGNAIALSSAEAQIAVLQGRVGELEAFIKRNVADLNPVYAKGDEKRIIMEARTLLNPSSRHEEGEV